MNMCVYDVRVESAQRKKKNRVYTRIKGVKAKTKAT